MELTGPARVRERRLRARPTTKTSLRAKETLLVIGLPPGKALYVVGYARSMLSGPGPDSAEAKLREQDQDEEHADEKGDSASRGIATCHETASRWI